MQSEDLFTFDIYVEDKLSNEADETFMDDSATNASNSLGGTQCKVVEDDFIEIFEKFPDEDDISSLNDDDEDSNGMFKWQFFLICFFSRRLLGQ